MSVITGKMFGRLILIQWTITVTGFVATYTIAVLRKDAPAWLPYISVVGGYHPQCSILGTTLSIAAVLDFVISCALYRVIMEEFKCKKIQRRCRAFATFGFIHGAGKILVATSPVDVTQFSLDKFLSQVGIHSLGTLMIGLGGFGFMVYGTVLTNNTKLRFKTSNRMVIFRAFLAAGNILAMCFMVAFILQVDPDPNGLKCVHTKPSNEVAWKLIMEDTLCSAYYDVISIAAIGEWLTFLTFAIYFLTLRHELRQVKAIFSFEITSSNQNLNIKNGRHILKNNSKISSGRKFVKRE